MNTGADSPIYGPHPLTCKHCGQPFVASKYAVKLYCSQVDCVRSRGRARKAKGKGQRNADG